MLPSWITKSSKTIKLIAAALLLLSGPSVAHATQVYGFSGTMMSQPGGGYLGNVGDQFWGLLYYEPSNAEGPYYAGSPTDVYWTGAVTGIVIGNQNFLLNTENQPLDSLSYGGSDGFFIYDHERGGFPVWLSGTGQVGGTEIGLWLEGYGDWGLELEPPSSLLAGDEFQGGSFSLNYQYPGDCCYGIGGNINTMELLYSVPEPTSLALLGLGLVGMGMRTKRNLAGARRC